MTEERSRSDTDCLTRPVVVIKRSASTAKNTGIDVYSNSVERALSSHGIPFETVNTVMDTKAGYLRFLTDGILKPFLSIIRKRDKRVYHAIDELCCLFLPFAKGKKVVSFHHVITDSGKDMKASFIWHLAAKMGLMFSDEIVAISPQTKRELISTYGIRDDRITVLLSEVSAAFVTLKDVRRERTIGCVSTLIKRKNVDALIRSFSILTEMDGMSDVKLKICGKGPEKEALGELAASLGISERVVFLSDLSVDDIVRFYNSVSVLANPSLHEGFGYVTLEAQRCSAPVVFFGHADIPSEVTKCAVPCDDEKDLAGKMYMLMTDEGYRESVVNAGKDYADAFGREFPEKLVNVYQRLMDRT